MSNATYRITLAGLLISDGVELAKAVFGRSDWTVLVSDEQHVQVTFSSPQTPADLGPLVKVETLDG